MNYLEIKHIKKSFGDLQVLKDISLTVSEGRCWQSSVPPALESPHCCAVPLFWKKWTAGSCPIWERRR